MADRCDDDKRLIIERLNRTLLQPLLVSLSRPSSRPASPSRSPPPGSPIVNRFLPAINQDYLTASSSIPADRSSSSLPAHFPPRTSNDPGPTVESQGFVLYVGSLVAWFGYLVWSLCKDEWLEAMGIAWYPSRCVLVIPYLCIQSHDSRCQR